MKPVILGVLLVVAVIAGGVVWGPRLFNRLPGENQRVKHRLYFRCEACGHAFGLSPVDLGAMWKDVTPTPATQGKATCPKCRKPFLAFRTNEADYRKGDLPPAAITKPVEVDRQAQPPPR